MIIHLSTDVIYIWLGSIVHSIAYDDLERNFPKILIPLIQEQKPTWMVVINGPAGFTALRIGAVIINLVKREYQEIEIYDWSKIDVYKHAVVNGFLPQKGYITIGQKKNVWIYDFSADTYQQVSVQNFSAHEQPSHYFIDMIGDHALCDLLEKQNMVKLYGVEGGVGVMYRGNNMIISSDELCNQEKNTIYISPNYMIQPSIG